MTPYTQLLNRSKSFMDFFHPTMTIAEKTALINLLTLLYRKLLAGDPGCDPIKMLNENLKITTTEQYNWFYSYSMVAIALIDNNIGDESEIHKYGLTNGADIVKTIQKYIDTYSPF